MCVCGVLQDPRHPSTSSFSRRFAKTAMMQQCAAMYLVATTGVCAVAAAVDLGVSRAVPPSPSASSYRLFVATCGIGELEPMLLTVVQPTSKGRSEVPTATLTQFGPVVGTVGSASKWVVEHPLHSVLVSWSCAATAYSKASEGWHRSPRLAHSSPQQDMAGGS